MLEWKKSIVINIFSLIIILLLLIPASTSHIYLPWYGREDTVKIGEDKAQIVSNMGMQDFWITNSSSTLDRYFTISFGKPANATSNKDIFNDLSYGTNASDPNYYGEKDTYKNMPYFLAGALIMNLLALLFTVLVGTKKVVKEAGMVVGVIALIGMLLPVLYFMLTFKGGIMGFLYYSDSFSGNDYTYSLLKHPSWGWVLGIFAVVVQGLALRALSRQMTDVRYMKRAIKESKGPKKQELENGMAGLTLSLIVIIILIVAPYIYLLIPWEYVSAEYFDGEKNVKKGFGMDTQHSWNADNQFKSIYLDRNKEHLLKDENGTVEEPTGDYKTVGDRVSYLLIAGEVFTIMAIGVAYSAKTGAINQAWAMRLSILAGIVVLLAPLYFVAGYADVNQLSYMDIIYHKGNTEFFNLSMNVSYAWFLSLTMGIVNIAAGVHMRSKTAKLEKQVKKISSSFGVDPNHLIGANAISQESSFTTNAITNPGQIPGMGGPTQMPAPGFAPPAQSIPTSPPPFTQQSAPQAPPAFAPQNASFQNTNAGYAPPGVPQGFQPIQMPQQRIQGQMKNENR